ncbi:hypothetical protein QR676_10370 [Vibrio sp. TMPB1044]|uniref:hypothetical protein n=1 Tax=Vibrio sp. TMPB1044 TaxID=3051822 RepID=UPI00255C0E9E|nr:hypothetical protein [Vibrio sp. TMPB1044]MDL5027633.1 hypothetical protein [Vibrio sp. TMPB1044]MDN5207761.1 hypothetical protein [Vibrio sp. TMPB1044]
MDKNQYLLETELEQLKTRADSEPSVILEVAQQCLVRSEQVLFEEGAIQSLMLMARCCWNLMDYQKGLKYIKEAYKRQSQLDTDLFLPEILHLHALQFWGQAKYYSAQQFWINALEQSALVDEVEIQIECLIGLGNIWRMTHEYKLARSTHQLAVKVANNSRIGWLEGKARILLAWDYYLLNNYVEMLSVLDGAEEALKDHKDNTWHAEVWDFRGLALLGLERLDDAERATAKAHNLAVEHNLVWMKAHSYISRARLKLLRKKPEQAAELLRLAEQSANEFDNGELLSQICYQQSLVAEENQDFKAALVAFKKYRQYSIGMLKEQTNRVGLDKARSSKRQLEQRARKLINRIRGQHEYDPEKHLSYVVSETFWWEKLVLFKTELKRSNHSIIMFHHVDTDYLDVCTEIAHTLCNQNDFIARLSSERVALMLSEKGEVAEQTFQTLSTMLDIYPWHRRGLKGSRPAVSLNDILTFPFTLEQLEEDDAEVTG